MGRERLENVRKAGRMWGDPFWTLFGQKWSYSRTQFENSMLDQEKNLIGLVTRFNESRPDLAS